MIKINIFSLINTQNPGCTFYWPDTIGCESNEILDLKKEFMRISNELGANNKTFTQFYLNAPTDEIPENVFIDIEFEKIYMFSNFTQIHSNAFNSTSLYTQEYNNLSADSKLRNNPPEYDFYKAFNSLVNLTDLVIRTDGDTVHEIPDYAFSNQQTLLKQISVYGGPISRIGNYAFFNLSSVTLIDISPPIQKISAHAFDFQFSSDAILRLDLFQRQLDENCLEDGIFQNPSRKIYLNLGIGSKNRF